MEQGREWYGYWDGQSRFENWNRHFYLLAPWMETDRLPSEQSIMKVYSACRLIELRTPLFNLQTVKCIDHRFEAKKIYLNNELVFIFFAISSFFSCGSVIQLGSLFFSTWIRKSFYGSFIICCEKFNFKKSIWPFGNKSCLCDVVWILLKKETNQIQQQDK